MKLLNALLFIFVSFAAQAQWVNITVPHIDSASYYQLHTPNSNTLWTYPLNFQNATRKYLTTADGGATWKYDSINKPNYFISDMWPMSADTCFAAMYSNSGLIRGQILKTTNRGATWARVDTGVTWAFPDVMHFWNSQEGIVIGDPVGPGTSYLQVERTNNGGNTWTRVDSNNLSISSRNEQGVTGKKYAVIGDKMWVILFNGINANNDTSDRIFYSPDRGEHWTAYSIVLRTPGYADIAFTDTLHGFVLYYSRLLATSDGGQTWTAKQPTTGDYFRSSLEVFPNSSTLFTCGGGDYGSTKGLAYSNDFGDTWVTVDTLSHMSLHFVNDTLGWSGEYTEHSTSPGGLYKWTRPTSVGIGNNPDLNISVSIFPNPSTGLFYLKVQNAGLQTIKTTITDLQGKVLLSNTYVEAGPFLMRAIDISQLATGIYFVNTEVSGNRYVQKLVKW